MRRLTIDDLSSIVSVETKSFVPGVRVSEECLRKRLELGHIMVGIEDGKDLVGVISFLYANFDPENRDAFPKTQHALSMQPMCEGANAGFIYNLAIVPGSRELRMARNLYREAAQAIVEAGCTYTVGAVRVPSYCGSQDHTEEDIIASPQVAQAIDRYLAGGAFPTKEELLHDPLLAFHQRTTSGTFLWIQEEFEPEDTASGRMGVIIYVQAKDMLEHLNSGRESQV